MARGLVGVALGLWLAIAPAAPAAPPSSEPAAPAGELGHVRQDTVILARGVQEREGAVAALDHELDLLGREAAGRQRGLDESRVEQEQLLGTLERLSRHPPDATPQPAQPPVDQPVVALRAMPGTLRLRLCAAAPRVAEGEAWWSRGGSNP